MLKNFQISAPGKIILHGEHSVVYNKPAIAGPIGLKTYFNFHESSNDFILLQYERLNLTAKMTLSNANLFLTELDCNESLQPMEFLQKIRNSKDFFLKYIEHNFDERKLNDKEEMAVAATLYILNRILKCEKVKSIKQGFDIKIDSDMSIGAGVGSSASYGVCLAAGFYIYSQILIGKLNEQQLKEFSFERNDTILERISLWAFDSEIIMHEKPSGIDNTICTYGQLIKFIRGQSPELIKMHGKIDILLVDTGVSRSTSHIVAKVANFKNKYSNLANSIFDAMGYLVDDVVKILENQKEADEKYQELSLLVSVNNNLLRSIGVSHPRLEKVFQLAELYGFQAKLTGAGGGGCCFCLLPANYRELEAYRKLCEDLTANNYQIMTTDIVDGSGVEFKFL
ncbi:hypothetical protein PVAND_006258 [Polypedilum vanderplanki]|uniref:Mevalonate kinase n=1 Tax=Polypedilum vanderplanki TaxID=319348 RepID=A0A9J6C2L7_POLVA|nr:hypothetical protein PVAND_006258 [Polypedilum vanderplanki]